MRAPLLALPLLFGAGLATAQTPPPIVPCGGDFATFRDAMEAEAVARGADPAVAAQFFDGVRQDPETLAADQRQGVFTLPFTEFARRLISESRLSRGRTLADQHDGVFSRVESEHGVPREVLLAFWAFETDYGAVQGEFNTVNSLMTLSHDCRRPGLFQPQVLAAVELSATGSIDPDTTTGAWAGEIGQVQMLPEDILENGTDGDGDGRVDLKTSVPDALVSGGRMIASLGWRPDEPWLEEVAVPDDFDWSQAGLDTRRPAADWQAEGVSPRDGTLDAPSLSAALVLPQGKDGPAFLAYPNFDVFFEWNQSYTYVLTAAYFATRLEGAEIFEPGTPTPPLSDTQMRELQSKLAQRGHDVGEIDGILGAGTRAAVRAEQDRLGLPGDAWPTTELLSQL